jgi:ribosomal RNA methyltransferase Nop2
MGRKADRKQAPPRPMPGSDAFKPRQPKGKKKASGSTNEKVSIKAPRGPFAKSKKERQKKAEKKLEIPEEEEDDSDLEDALKQGELSEDEDEEETVKIKSFKKKDDGADLRNGPVKELVFSDSEEEDDVVGDENEQLPPGLHTFDLDEAPGSEDEEMDDEFDMGSEDDEEMEEDDEVDSAFASSNEGEDEGDVDMDDDMEDEDEDGDIQTNLEDDLTNEGFTLPAVDGIEEEHEHGTSLRDVETRMRWLVGVCVGKEERTSKGVPGQYVLFPIHKDVTNNQLPIRPLATTRTRYCNLLWLQPFPSQQAHATFLCRRSSRILRIQRIPTTRNDPSQHPPYSSS